MVNKFNINGTTVNFESSGVIENKNVDLIIFAGQSNMAGRGVSNTTWPAGYPNILNGAGYEFRAVSDPLKLYKIEEPFGVNEDNQQMDDKGRKSGSLVTAFVNSYYTKSKIPVIAVSASRGGSSINAW